MVAVDPLLPKAHYFPDFVVGHLALLEPRHLELHPLVVAGPHCAPSNNRL